MSVLQREFDNETRNVIMNCQIIDGGGGGGGAFVGIVPLCLLCVQSYALHSLDDCEEARVNACRGPYRL